MVAEVVACRGKRFIVLGLVPPWFACVDSGRLVRATDLRQAFAWFKAEGQEK